MIGTSDDQYWYSNMALFCNNGRAKHYQVRAQIRVDVVQFSRSISGSPAPPSDAVCVSLNTLAAWIGSLFRRPAHGQVQYASHYEIPERSSLPKQGLLLPPSFEL
jgi:hypothetical protein